VHAFLTRYTGLRPALALALALAAASCAAGPYAPSDDEYARAREARRAEYERERREREAARAERREQDDWADWIADQRRDPGPVVLERADLVLKAAIARAEYGADSATRLTNLRMTDAARRTLVEGATERALDLLERAIAVDGREGFAYLYLGYIYVRRGEVDRAREFLDQAERLLPPDAQLGQEVAHLRDLAGAGARRGVR
jgi:Flp pilus assembly protein TadD